MKVYISRDEEFDYFHGFISVENPFYFDIPREVSGEAYMQYCEAREKFYEAYEKLKDEWDNGEK